MNGLQVEVFYPKVNGIVMLYLKSDQKNIKEHIVCFHKYQQIYQYVYSMLFSKVFVQNQKHSVDSYTFFMLHFKDWQDKNC